VIPLLHTRAVSSRCFPAWQLILEVINHCWPARHPVVVERFDLTLIKAAYCYYFYYCAM